MSFLSSLKKVLNIGQTAEKKKRIALQNIKVSPVLTQMSEILTIFNIIWVSPLKIKQISNYSS